MNKKKTRLWNDVMKKINSIHGNNRDVKEVKKKWNNLKGSAKACVDCSRSEARRTGGGYNYIFYNKNSMIFLFVCLLSELIEELVRSTDLKFGMRVEYILSRNK